MRVSKMRVLGGPLLLLVFSALAAAQVQNETRTLLRGGTHRQLPIERGHGAPIIIPAGPAEDIKYDTDKIVQMRTRLSIPQGFARSQEAGSQADVQFAYDEPVHTMMIRQISTPDEQSVALYGEEVDADGKVVSTITLLETSYDDKLQTTGSFWNGNDLYQVSFDAEGNEMVLKQNVDQFIDGEHPEDDQLLDASEDDSERRMLQENHTSWSRELQYKDDPGILDVMVLYTKATMCQAAFNNNQRDCPVNAKNQRPIEAQIDLAILESNMAFENSKIPAKFRLVHTHMDPDFSEFGKPIDDIIRNMRSTFSYVDSMRDAVGADFVVLLIEDSPYW
jgi:hypothetical protein